VIEQAAQPVDDREPEPQPPATASLRRGELVELAEDFLPLVLGNADSAVPDFDPQPVAAAAAAD